MSTRRASRNSKSDDEEPRLRVTSQDARERLEARIAEGNHLLEISIKVIEVGDI